MYQAAKLPKPQSEPMMQAFNDMTQGIEFLDKYQGFEDVCLMAVILFLLT